MAGTDTSAQQAVEQTCDRLQMVVPDEIRRYKQWVLWRYEPGDDKPRKVPYYACGQRRSGVQGSEADLGQLATFDIAAARLRRGGFDGLGLAILPNSPIKAIDLDACVVAGKLLPQAEAIVAEADSYAEISPSGTGVRILAFGVLPSKKAMHKFGPGQHLELFGTSGFVTITGNVLGSSTLRPMPAAFQSWVIQQVTGAADAAPQEQRPAHTVTIDATQRAHLRSALTALPADDYATWCDMGLALKSLGDVGRSLWLEWSQLSPRFDAGQAAKKWLGFSPDGRINFQTVFYRAGDAKWVNPASAVAAKAPSAQEEMFAPLDLEDMAGRDVLPIRFVVDKWLPAKAVTVLTAHGGVGKSTMSLQLAVSLVLGRPWFGKDVTQCRVLLVSCEDSEQAIHWRLDQVCRHMGVTLADLGGLLTIFDMTERDCVLWARGQATPRMQWLQMVSETYDPGCLIVDNASDTYADNENDRSAVRGFVRTLAKIAIANDSAVLLLAHVDKASARGVIESSDNYSGSTAWNNSARSRWAMVRNKDNSIEIANEKNNYAARQDPFKVEYDLIQHVFVGCDLAGSSVASDLLRNQGRLDIMRAVLKANESSDRLSISRNANNNAFRVLRAGYGLSQNMTPEDFWSHIDTLDDWKYVENIQYQKASRSIGMHMVLTAAGRGKVANNSGAAPVWSKE